MFLAYASEHGHAFLDRALYLPQSWADDRERRERAGIPDEIAFATKPELARQRQVRDVIAEQRKRAWQRLSAGDGTKGPRLYDWCRVKLAAPLVAGWSRWLLLRRSCSDSTDVTDYVVFARSDTSIAALVRVAGTRWTIETGFEAAKSEVGLDQYEVRSWTGWYRHITLALLAHAILAAIRVRVCDDDLLKKGLPKTTAMPGMRAFRR